MKSLIRPDKISGLRVWFDASDTTTINNGIIKNGEVVQSFKDKISNFEVTNIIPNNGPTYQFGLVKGKNAIQFAPTYVAAGEGAQKALGRTNITDTIMASDVTSMFCVYQPTGIFVNDAGGNNKYVITIGDNNFHNGGGGFANKQIYVGEDGSTTAAQRDNPSGRYLEADITGGYTTTNGYTIYSSYHEHVLSQQLVTSTSLNKICMTAVRNRNGIQKMKFVKGLGDDFEDFQGPKFLKNPSGSQRTKLSGQVYPISTPYNFVIGAWKARSYTHNANKYPFVGNFCEFLYFNRFLTDEESNAIVHYLKNKWVI